MRHFMVARMYELWLGVLRPSYVYRGLACWYWWTWEVPKVGCLQMFRSPRLGRLASQHSELPLLKYKQESLMAMIRHEMSNEESREQQCAESDDWSWLIMVDDLVCVSLQHPPDDFPVASRDQGRGSCERGCPSCCTGRWFSFWWNLAGEPLGKSTFFGKYEQA